MIYVVMLMAVVYLVARYTTIGLARWRASRAPTPAAPDCVRDRSAPTSDRLSTSDIEIEARL